jgi:hypothetical protein
MIDETIITILLGMGSDGDNRQRESDKSEDTGEAGRR